MERLKTAIAGIGVVLLSLLLLLMILVTPGLTIEVDVDRNGHMDCGDCKAAPYDCAYNSGDIQLQRAYWYGHLREIRGNHELDRPLCPPAPAGYTGGL